MDDIEELLLITIPVFQDLWGVRVTSLFHFTNNFHGFFQEPLSTQMCVVPLEALTQSREGTDTLGLVHHSLLDSCLWTPLPLHII